MKVVFLGGGSLRLLPLIRGVFWHTPEFFRNGEICLVDKMAERAEAVGKLMMACPEYESVRCKITWSTDLDTALPGTDIVYLTMGARRQPTRSQAMFLANQYGYIYTDNLSINGAFLSLRLGRTILDIARKMEKYCPEALMLIFPNPVAVYSHLVNTHTKIKALGICGGFSNHRWDLTRVLGRNEYDPGWNVVAAGVNHMSFILRGTWHGKDIYKEVLPERLTPFWKPLEIETGNPWLKESYERAQLAVVTMFKKYGSVVFSTEMDGLFHLFPDDELAFQRKRYGFGENFDPVQAVNNEQNNIRQKYEEFIASSKNPRAINWDAPSELYSRKESDIIIPIFRAVSGQESMRIVASRPNNGAVRNLRDDMPLEYTMDILGREITPVEDQYIPEPFCGLVSALAEFQRLQSEAIAAWDPALFAAALDAYPVDQFKEKRKIFFRKMFDLFSDLDPHMLSAGKYFEPDSSRRQEHDKRYRIEDMKELEPIRCPCGFTRRAFASDSDKTASLHIVDIQQDSKVHYHQEHTEIYHILEGSGWLELEGEKIPVQPGLSIRISPYCRHRAVGKLKVMNVSIPAFDPRDEWFD